MQRATTTGSCFSRRDFCLSSSCSRRLAGPAVAKFLAKTQWLTIIALTGEAAPQPTHTRHVSQPPRHVSQPSHSAHGHLPMVPDKALVARQFIGRDDIELDELGAWAFVEDEFVDDEAAKLAKDV